MIRTNHNGTELRILRLVYTTDEQPGISRVRRGRGFQYLLPDKSHLNDRVELARIYGDRIYGDSALNSAAVAPTPGAGVESFPKAF